MGDLGSFSLDDDGSEVFRNLQTNDYEITEVVPNGWLLAGVAWTGGDSGLADGGVIIHLDAGENITCAFTSEAGGIGRYSYFFPCACAE